MSSGRTSNGTPVSNTGVAASEAGRFDEGAFTDWLRVSFDESLVLDAGAMDRWSDALFESFGCAVEVVERNKGFMNFERASDLRIGGAVVGRLAWGGEFQRGRALLDVPGEGCGRVRDWASLILLIEDSAARITRLDVAADFMAPGLLDAAIAAWRVGAFTSHRMEPTAQLIDDLGSRKGRTFSVGSRQSDKYCRIYEKGLQLGAAGSAWIRVEVEFKAKGTVLPLGCIVDSSELFRGAYPFTAALLPGAQEKPLRVARASQIVVGRAVEIAAQQVGGVVGWLSRVGGFPSSAIVRMLARDPSDRLCGGVLDPEAPRELVLVGLSDADDAGYACSA